LHVVVQLFATQASPAAHWVAPPATKGVVPLKLKVVHPVWWYQ
jgi:hypothetical protein